MSAVWRRVCIGDRGNVGFTRVSSRMVSVCPVKLYPPPRVYGRWNPCRDCSVSRVGSRRVSAPRMISEAALDDTALDEIIIS